MSVQDGYPKVFDERTPADENGSVSSGAASDWDWKALNLGFMFHFELRLRLAVCRHSTCAPPCSRSAARHLHGLPQDQLAQGRHPGLRQAADRVPQLRHR